MNTFFLLAFRRLCVLARGAAAQARARGKVSLLFSLAPRAGKQSFFLPGSCGRVVQLALEPESSALHGKTENPVVGARFVCAGFALSLQRSVGLSQAPNWSFNRTLCGMRALGIIAFLPKARLPQNAG
jgi:hypothetical protein